MSGTFTGFSEEDIRKLRSGVTYAKTNESRKIMKAKRNENSRNVNKNIVLNNAAAVFEMIPDSAKLNIKAEKKSTQNDENLKQDTDVPLVENPVTTKIVENKPVEFKNVETINEKTVTLDFAKVEKRVIDLDEFQARQKLIEEQNRKRKELLSKALADRTKRTEEETRKLNEIKDEFKKLDASLSNDVSILRHQIEVASLEFMEAQKKYHRIEKEFLDSKLNLHKKLERKERLTEYLCAIIEKNEERKAEKLSELMNRLEVDGGSFENDTSHESINEPKAENDINENGENLIEEIKNRREIKIELQPEKNTEDENEI